MIRDSAAREDFLIKSTKEYLERLFMGRHYVREEALSKIVQYLTTYPYVLHEFLENNFETLLYQCLLLTTKAKGYAKQQLLASKIIGLIAMTISTDNAHKVYEESIPGISKFLQTKAKHSKILLQSMAMVAFFGADDTRETMLLIWNNFLRSEMGSGSSDIVAAAISCWCFLLSKLEGWRLNYKDWQGAISYLTEQLDNKDKAVCVAASEALAVIFEFNCLKKFTSPDNVTSEHQEPRNKIIEKLRCLSDDVSDVLSYFEEGNLPDMHVKIDKHELTLSTWSQRVQVKFLRSFLGEAGFINQIMKNENIQDIFELMPEEEKIYPDPDNMPYKQKIMVRFCIPTELRNNSLELPSDLKTKMLSYQWRPMRQEKRIIMSPNSLLNKSRSQLLKKLRQASFKAAAEVWEEQ